MVLQNDRYTQRQRQSPVRQRAASVAANRCCGIEWDGVDRVSHFGNRYLNLKQTHESQKHGEYVNKVIELNLLAMVGRQFSALKFEQVIILEGAEGTGKSSCFAFLVDGSDHAHYPFRCGPERRRRPP